jgi:HEAT repeat protein
MDDLQGLPRALTLARDPGPHRAEALRVLGGFRVKEAVPPLLAALEDNELAVRNAAFLGLQSLLLDLFPFRRFDLASTYSASAPEAQRREGAARISAWWQAASTGLKGSR